MEFKPRTTEERLRGSGASPDTLRSILRQLARSGGYFCEHQPATMEASVQRFTPRAKEGKRLDDGRALEEAEWQQDGGEYSRGEHSRGAQQRGTAEGQYKQTTCIQGSFQGIIVPESVKRALRRVTPPIKARRPPGNQRGVMR